MVSDVALDVDRSGLKGIFESLDPEESSLVIEGKSYQKAKPKPGHAITIEVLHTARNTVRAIVKRRTVPPT